ncbi:MAG: hypothetical protein ACR2PM_19035, partial [Hyphomicrobiales bacterium]
HKMRARTVMMALMLVFPGVAQSGEIHGGAGKCIDVHAQCQAQNGCKAQVWDCNGTRQQTWSVY